MLSDCVRRHYQSGSIAVEGRNRVYCPVLAAQRFPGLAHCLGRLLGVQVMSSSPVSDPRLRLGRSTVVGFAVESQFDRQADPIGTADGCRNVSYGDCR